MKDVHFIFSGNDRSWGGGGTSLWKTLLKKPPFPVHLHYSSLAVAIWKEIRHSNLIHHIHPNWRTHERRQHPYDGCHKDFDVRQIGKNDIVIFDGRESVQQLTLALTSRGTPFLIWHMQSPEHLLRKNPFIMWKDLIPTSRINHIIAISKYVKNIYTQDPLYRLLRRKTPISVVYNGIISSFEKIESQHDNILYFGRYERYKKPLFLEKLNLEKEGISTRYIGSAASAQSPVTIPPEKDLGWMSPRNAAMYGDIFIFPAIGEAFGLAVLEMMSYGKIVIAFNSGAFPEFITNGKDGFLVKPEDVTSTQQIIGRLHTHRELREQIGRQAIDKAKMFHETQFRKVFWQTIVHCEENVNYESQ